MSTQPYVVFPIWDQRQFSFDRQSCAILMPFGDPDFEAVYQEAIEPAITAEELIPVRADRSAQPKVVDYIWTVINEANLVVADISGGNPNVLYELGVAHTLGTPAIILRSESAGAVPFDVRHLRSIKYSNTSAGRTELLNDLRVSVGILRQAHPTGHRLLDELEYSATQWRGPSRDFGFLYSPGQLARLQQFIPPQRLSDTAVGFCAASACQHGSAGQMVHWGHHCNSRAAAATELAFGLFNHQRRPKLRIAYLLGQMDDSIRVQALAQVSEHGLQGEILDAISSGTVAEYIVRNREALGLTEGELTEEGQLLRNSQLVFRRPMP